MNKQLTRKKIAYQSSSGFALSSIVIEETVVVAAAFVVVA
jgi:hypothetical protein